MAKKGKVEQEEPLKNKLWRAADKLRKNMDAAEYKHVALGLIFLKYISDAFEEQYQKLVAQKSDGADPEDKNEYLAEKVFFVPQLARWSYVQGKATQPTIGKDIDEAMDAIEKDNPSLRGVLPKVYAQEKLDKASLGGLVNLIGSATLGTKEAQSKDILGQVFEYFLGEFALAEGKKGGQFYTPGSVVKLLVEMLEPYEGRVFDHVAEAVACLCKVKNSLRAIKTITGKQRKTATPPLGKPEGVLTHPIEFLFTDKKVTKLRGD